VITVPPLQHDCSAAPFCTRQAISTAQIECSRQSFFAHLTDALARQKLRDATQYHVEMLSKQAGGSDAFSVWLGILRSGRVSLAALRKSSGREAYCKLQKHGI
jgi:hypothetical protein